MHDDKPISSTKILPITLKMLDSILETSERLRKSYKNNNFEYLLFVARLVSMGDSLVFSDGTRVLNYEPRINQTGLKLMPNIYYQCLCCLKSMDRSFRMDIINLSPVDGNFITMHMARVIKKDVDTRCIELR